MLSTSEPTAFAIRMQSMTCRFACACARSSGLHGPPNLYTWSSNRFGLIDPIRTPCRSATFAVCCASTPTLKSHNTCTATVGQHPVNLFTTPASASFSSIVEAAAACLNFPNRVPVSAYPQLGVSIRNSSRSEEHTSELQSLAYLVCRLLLEKKNSTT